MLLAGSAKCIPDMKNLMVFNLSSLLEGYHKVDILPPVTQIDYNNQISFDISYSNYIMMNDNIFYEFFSKIINPLYYGVDVYLIVTRNIFYDCITESLFKFIQQRYGYPCAMIGDTTDVDYLNPDVGFTTAGIYNLDLDKERFSVMYTMQHLDPNTGKIEGFD
jgi:hypothetical protein